MNTEERDVVTYEQACMSVLEIGNYLGLNLDNLSLIISTMFNTYPEDDYWTLNRMEEAKELILK